MPMGQLDSTCTEALSKLWVNWILNSYYSPTSGLIALAALCVSQHVAGGTS
jgi:hypothetical protein